MQTQKYKVQIRKKRVDCFLIEEYKKIYLRSLRNDIALVIKSCIGK